MSDACRRENCVQCCVETEMPLSNEDVERIEELGFKRAEFTVDAAGWIRLKNAGGRCVFNDGSECRIYDGRPEGCRLYPVVYDEDKEDAALDYDCPSSEEFELGKDATQELLELIGRLKEERKKRLGE